ncbi:flagellar biosynthetic protein FliR [Chitinimonas sp. PSY-7]|uniref:flagellar biosynthetic protein FliR n=1 Tax=Chitinimonas sp. PSY-7 TaxID=3459088 RepID=UPI0040400447
MRIDFDLAWVAAVLLCSLRLAAAIALTPLLSGFSIPARLRVLILLALSVCMISPANLSAIPQSNDTLDLVQVALCELAFGAALAFGVFAAFSSFSLAGRILDLQIGFSVGGLFDPVTRRQSPILAAFFDLFAVVSFFLANLHHTLLRGFMATLEAVPPGTASPFVSPLLLSQQMTVMFVNGLKLAAPVVICLLLVDIGLATLSRNIPQFNIFVISLPIKTLVGIAVLAVVIRYMGPSVSRALNAIFPYWSALVA